MNLPATFNADHLWHTEEELEYLRELQDRTQARINRLEIRRSDLMREREWIKTNPEGR